MNGTGTDQRLETEQRLVKAGATAVSRSVIGKAFIIAG